MSRTKTARPKYDGVVMPDNLELSHVTHFKGVALRPEITINGCVGCYFTTTGGARYCEHLTACLGRYRKDKQSVIFIKVI